MSFTALPIIDVSPLTRANRAASTPEERLRVAREIHRACCEVGFFYTVGHGVPVDLMERVISLGREFFTLPLEEKEKISVYNTPYKPPQRGYQRLGVNITQKKMDWHEAIDYLKDIPADDPRVLAGKPLHAPNQWPANPPEFRAVYELYVQEMLKLGEALMSGIAMGLGLPEDYFLANHYIDDPFWSARTIGYPPLDTADCLNGGTSCGEHSDYGCLTMVNQDPTKGALQVKNAAGQWINADPIPGAFVTNIGDMLMNWTSGLYKSTRHRVVHTGQTYRVSVPFFFEPNFDAIITPLDICTRSAERQQFEPIMYGDHLLYKVTNNFYPKPKD